VKEKEKEKEKESTDKPIVVDGSSATSVTSQHSQHRRHRQLSGMLLGKIENSGWGNEEEKNKNKKQQQQQQQQQQHRTQHYNQHQHQQQQQQHHPVVNHPIRFVYYTEMDQILRFDSDSTLQVGGVGFLISEQGGVGVCRGQGLVKVITVMILLLVSCFM